MPKKIQCYVILRKRSGKLFAAIPSTSSFDLTKTQAKNQFASKFRVSVLNPKLFKKMKNKFKYNNAPVFMGTVSWGGTRSIPKFMGNKTTFG